MVKTPSFHCRRRLYDFCSGIRQQPKKKILHTLGNVWLISMDYCVRMSAFEEIRSSSVTHFSASPPSVQLYDFGF